MTDIGTQVFVKPFCDKIQVYGKLNQWLWPILWAIEWKENSSIWEHPMKKEQHSFFHGIYQSFAWLSFSVLMGSKHQSALPELFSLLHVISISPKREAISSPKILQQFSMRNCTRPEICNKAKGERCQIFSYSTPDKLTIQMRNRSKLLSMKAARNYSLSLLGLINCPGKYPCKYLFHSTLSCSEVTTTTDPLEERSILLTHWALLYDLSPLLPERLWEWTDEYFWSPDKRTSPDLKRYWVSSCLQPTAWLNGMKVGWVFCYTKVFLTFLINSLSISGVEDTGGQSRLGAMQTARLKAFIWFSSDRISIPCSTPKM